MGSDTSPKVNWNEDRLFLFVLTAWLGVLLATLGFVLKFGSSVPFMDDLDMVQPLTQPGSFGPGWLWSQHVVHRIPLPRLLYMALVAPTHEVRTVLIVDVALLGAVSLAMIVAARRIRGRGSVTDLFFPLVWLHWGNAPNLLFPFAFTFVLPTALSSIVLVVIATRRQLVQRVDAVRVCIATLALPLCGGPGVAQAPIISLMLGVVGWRAVRDTEVRRRREGWMLIAFAVATTSLSGAYFIGFELQRERADVLVSMKTAAKFMSLGIGPFAKPAWPISGVVVLGLAALVVGLLTRELVRRRPERERTVALLFYIMAMAATALAVGVKTEAWSAGFADRYITLPTPFVCASYLVLLLYAPGIHGAIARGTLTVLLVCLMPTYTASGIEYAREHRARHDALSTAARESLPLKELARRHWVDFYSSEEHMVHRLEGLKKASLPPFDTTDPPDETSR